MALDTYELERELVQADGDHLAMRKQDTWTLEPWTDEGR